MRHSKSPFYPKAAYGTKLKKSSLTEHKLEQTTKQRPIMPLAKREDILIFPKLYTFVENCTCNDGPHFIFQSVSIDQIGKSVLEMNHQQNRALNSIKVLYEQTRELTHDFLDYV